MRTLLISSAIAGAIGVAFTQPSYAVVLGIYEFTSGSQAASSVNSNVTFTNFAASSGLSGVAYNATGFSGAGAKANGWTTTNSLTDAVTNNDYFQFALEAISGQRLTSLSQITLNAWRDNNGPQSLQFQYSTNGTNFTSIGSTLSPGSGGNASQTNNWASLTANLSGIALGDGTSQVTFRLYGYNAGNANGDGHFDNVSVDGEVQPVPEPTTILGGMAALGVGNAVRRKWQKKQKAVA
jgi:trimeric autotransporter adhesin